MGRRNLKGFIFSHVADHHIVSGVSVAAMMNICHCALESQSSRPITTIQLLVIKPRINEGLGAASLGHLGDEVLNKRAGHASIPIGEVVNIWVLLVIDCHRDEPQRAALLGLADAEQFSSSARPINS